MKKLIRTLFAVVFAVSMPAFVSCSDDDEPESTEGQSELTTFEFNAETTVETKGVDGVYVNTEAAYVIDLSDDGAVATLTINNARFAAMMPAMTMQFKGIAVEVVDGSYVLTSDELVPEIAGTPFPRYTVTDLSGSFTGTSGSLFFTCAGIYEVKVRFLLPVSE